MNSKFCGKCGTTNAAQTSFCIQCGENLVKSEPPPSFGGQSPSTGGQPANFAPPSQFSPPPPNFQAAQNNYVPPNAGFQPPQQFQQSQFQQPQFQPSQQQQQFQEPANYKPEPQKSGIGSKIVSVLGILAVGAFFLLKFGFVLARAGRLGGIGLVAVIFLVIVAVGVYSLIKRGKG